MYNTIFFLLLASVLLGLNSGCAKKETVTEKQQLTVWAMGEEGVKLPELVKLFREENPDIEITIQAIPWSVAHEKLVTAAIGEILPDVCQLGTTWMSEFQVMGVLETLDEYISKSEIVKKQNYYPGSLLTCTIDDKVYGIPWYVDTRVMFYRKDLVKSPPSTWEELIKTGELLVKDTNKDGKIDEYAYAIPTQDWQVLCPFIWQNGAEMIDVKTRKPLFTDENVKEAVGFYVTLFRKNLAPTAAAGVDLFHAFKTGYYKMFFSGPWMLEVLKRELPELTGKWDVALMPKKKSPASFVGGCNLVIFKMSKNKEAAWKFIEFVSKPETQIEWYKLTTDIPAVKSVWGDKFFDDKPMLKTFAKQLEYAKSPPNIPEWEQVANAIHIRVEEAILGKKTVDVALSDLNNDVQQILRKQR